MEAVKPVVVDANVLFSALLRSESRFAQIILGTDRPFFICESTIVEIFKHKEKIVRLSKLEEDDLIRILYTLLRRLTVIKENLIVLPVRQQAYELCQDIDVTDTPFVALTLHLDGLLWTGDKVLKKGLREKDFEYFFEP